MTNEFLEQLVGMRVRIFFKVYDKAAARYDITGTVEAVSEAFLRISLNDKFYLINIDEISFIEYPNNELR